MTQFSIRRSKELSKMNQILRDSVSSCIFKVAPHEFIRIKLWGISWEKVGFNPAMQFNKPFDRTCSVNQTAIPYENDMPIDMFEEMPKKCLYFQCTDVFIRMKLAVQGNSFSFWRHADGRNSRYFRPVTCNRNARGLSSGRPSAFDTGNKQKSAFVKEYQMGSKTFRVFLYMAIFLVSISVWLLHRVLWLAFQVSDNSIREIVKTARDGSDDTLPQTASLLPLLPFWLSINRLDNHRQSRPLTVSGLTSAFGQVSTFLDVRVQAWVLWLRLHLLCASDAIEIPNLLNNRFSLPLPTRYISFLAARWHVGAASRVAFGFHMVSCIILYNIFDRFSIAFA